MGPQIKDVGGGAATGLANDYISQLQKMLNGGGLGTAGSPVAGGAGGGGIMSVLNDILGAGAGKVGGSISDILSKQQERDVSGIRARFGASGGGGYGTPGAFAESMYRSEAAPQITQAIGGLQLQAIMPLLSAITGLSGKGISQRETVQTPGAFSDITKMLGSVAGAAAPFLHPAFGAAGGGSNASSLFGGDAGAFSKFLQGASGLGGFSF